MHAFGDLTDDAAADLSTNGLVNASQAQLRGAREMLDVGNETWRDRGPPEPVACLSPYTREHIRRFGRYILDMDDLPEPLAPKALPFAA